LVGREPNVTRKDRARFSLYDAIPGYGGKSSRLAMHGVPGDSEDIRTRMNCNIPFATDERYTIASPRYRTNSKNKSGFVMGDSREQSWRTTQMLSYSRPAGYEDSAHSQSLVPVEWPSMTEDQRRVVYADALKFVTRDGVTYMISAVRAKIEQRISGGPFALRKAFKYFDRDGSGDIDPDEFLDAMAFFGLQFTERQVMALFGMCDVDGGGSIDYYEFIGRVLDSGMNFRSKDAIALRPKTPPVRKLPSSVTAYQQQLALVDLLNQVRRLDHGEYFSIPRDKIMELLKMANIPKFSHTETEVAVDLVERAVNLLAVGDIEHQTFWDWWAGNDCIPGLEAFPVPDNIISIIVPSPTQKESISPRRPEYPKPEQSRPKLARGTANPIQALPPPVRCHNPASTHASGAQTARCYQKLPHFQEGRSIGLSPRGGLPRLDASTIGNLRVTKRSPGGYAISRQLTGLL